MSDAEEPTFWEALSVWFGRLASEATAFAAEFAAAMRTLVERGAALFSSLFSPVSGGTTIVRPKRPRRDGCWLAWDGAGWSPVRRIAGVGWVWWG